MFADLAFFSFVQLTDPLQHRAYNDWHLLDHRPENLALPGVAWGDRWARTTQYKGTGTATAEFTDVDYAAMYWFRSPVAESVDAWDKLGGDSFQWGRGPLIPGVERRLLAFFRPVKGYAATRALVSPDVLPFRPNRGLHLTLTQFAEPTSLDTHALHQWEDRLAIPGLVDVPGVAGAWTFSFSHPQRHASLPFADTAERLPNSLRIRLLYLDDDPLETTARINDRLAAIEPPPAPPGTVLLATPLKTIIPWGDL